MGRPYLGGCVGKIKNPIAMPNNTNEDEWWKKDYLLKTWDEECVPAAWIPPLLAEHRSRARLEMAREMKEYVLNAKDSHMSQVVILALIQEKLNSIIQEEEGKV